MTKPERAMYLEMAGMILIRIACVAVCLCFFLPMFKVTQTLFDWDILSDTHTLTGFNMIFGLRGSGIYGVPFALVVFLYPAVVLFSTFMSFLDKYLYTVIISLGIAGAILSSVFFVLVLFMLNKKESVFDVTIHEMRAGFSWGVPLILVAYVIIVLFAFRCKRDYDE
jgi:hypothetical protein